jgi:hypothetical protein
LVCTPNISGFVWYQTGPLFVESRLPFLLLEVWLRKMFSSSAGSVLLWLNVEVEGNGKGCLFVPAFSSSTWRINNSRRLLCLLGPFLFSYSICFFLRSFYAAIAPYFLLQICYRHLQDLDLAPVGKQIGNFPDSLLPCQLWTSELDVLRWQLTDNTGWLNVLVFLEPQLVAVVMIDDTGVVWILALCDERDRPIQPWDGDGWEQMNQSRSLVITPLHLTWD